LKVTRSAMQNAVSAAGMILTTEAAVTDLEKPEDKSKTPSYPSEYSPEY